MLNMPVLKKSYTLHLFGKRCYLFCRYNSFTEINEAHFFLLSLCTGSNTLFDIINIAYEKFGNGIKKDTFESSIIKVFTRYSQKGIVVENDGTLSRVSCISVKKELVSLILFLLNYAITVICPEIFVI